MAADLRLVANAPHAYPDEIAPHGARDGAPERSLARAGRAGEAEDGTPEIVLELEDSEVLENPLLHLVQTEVLRVEPFRDLVQIDRMAHRLAPRQGEQPLDVVADHAGLL